MPQILEKLRARLAEIDEKLDAAISIADAENREFTAEETTECNAWMDERDKLIEQIATHERMASALSSDQPSRGRRVNPAANEHDTTRIEPVSSPLDRDRHGFHSFGDFLSAVRHGSPGGGHSIDGRLLAGAAPTTYGTEGSGTDGGFAVPPDYRSEIMATVEAETPLLQFCDQQTSSSNTFKFPQDNSAPWDTTGVRTYWGGEAKVLTESKPALDQVTVDLEKLYAMVAITEELAQDAPSLDRWIRTKAPQKIAFEVSRVIVNGSGAGQPLGILRSPCLVSVAKESAQTADTVVVENLVKMWSRCYAPARQNAVWLINQDVEPQLMTLMMEGTSSSVPVYVPPGGFSTTPYGTLFGRPVLATQACETLGDLGDIILAGLRDYMVVSKAMRQDVSMHIYFEYDSLAYRFILRLGGQPTWGSTLAARDGTATYSPFVALAERA